MGIKASLATCINEIFRLCYNEDGFDYKVKTLPPRNQNSSERVWKRANTDQTMSTTTIHHGALPTVAALSNASPGAAFLSRILPSLNDIDRIYQEVNLRPLLLPGAMCQFHGNDPIDLLTRFLKIVHMRSGLLFSNVREPSTIWDIGLEDGARTVIWRV